MFLFWTIVLFVLIVILLQKSLLQENFTKTAVGSAVETLSISMRKLGFSLKPLTYMEKRVPSNAPNEPFGDSLKKCLNNSKCEGITCLSADFNKCSTRTGSEKNSTKKSFSFVKNSKGTTWVNSADTGGFSVKSNVYFATRNPKGSKNTTYNDALKACRANKACEGITCLSGDFKQCSPRSGAQKKSTKNSISFVKQKKDDQFKKASESLAAIGFETHQNTYFDTYYPTTTSRNEAFDESLNRCLMQPECEAITCREMDVQKCSTRKGPKKDSTKNSVSFSKKVKGFTWVDLPKNPKYSIFKNNYIKDRESGSKDVTFNQASKRCLLNATCKGVTCVRGDPRKCSRRKGNVTASTMNSISFVKKEHAELPSQSYNNFRKYPNTYYTNKIGDLKKLSLEPAIAKCSSNNSCSGFYCSRGDKSNCWLASGKRKPSKVGSFSYAHIRPSETTQFSTDNLKHDGFKKHYNSYLSGSELVTGKLDSLKSGCLASSVCSGISCYKGNSNSCASKAAGVVTASKKGSTAFTKIHVPSQEKTVSVHLDDNISSDSIPTCAQKCYSCLNNYTSSL